MGTTGWTSDKTADTRERIITLLRRRKQTVEDLASQLGITRNAVRSHINLLKREGIVEPQGMVPSGRRPATVYGISIGETALFSKASPVVLSRLVQVLAEKLTGKQFSETMQELGHRLAAQGPAPVGMLKERLHNAVAYLESLGSIVDVIEKKDKIVIKGYGCPVAGAVSADGRFCTAMAVMIGDLVGLPTVERCERDTQPGCCFEIRLR
jgi:predicted ArsR family transcriptional regulator